MYPISKLLFYASAAVAVSAVAPPPFIRIQGETPYQTDVKVPVQLGVMSQCPDALLCESLFKTVFETVKEKADLSLVYVARCHIYSHVSSRAIELTIIANPGLTHQTMSSGFGVDMAHKNAPETCNSSVSQNMRQVG